MSEIQTEHGHEAHGHEEHAGLDKKRIWQVFGILLLITVIEFIIALAIMPRYPDFHHTGNFVYIALTLLKAYYIVAYFMHLKYEKVGLQLSLTLSFILIVYFIVLMLIEGDYLHTHMPLV